MFRPPQKKSEIQQMLDNYAVELAMFMRWCETCGSGPLSPVKCVEIAQLIFIRERFETPNYESLYVASIAASSSKAEIDKIRAGTGFDGKAKAFCESLGIELPYKKPSRVSSPVGQPDSTRKQADPRDQLPVTDELKATLARLKEAEYFRAELQYQVQFILPVLSDKLAAKAGYACAVKLLTAKHAGYSQTEWEENIANMLLVSDENFDFDTSVDICRRVEKSLETWCATFKSAGVMRRRDEALPKPSASVKESSSVYLNADLAGVTWLLLRSDNEFAINGGLLTLLLSVAAEHGWNAEGLKMTNGEGIATISLRPCRVAGYEATKLHNILLSAMSNPPSDQADEAAQAIQAFLTFLRGGGFNLQRRG
ncbi:hypothetical protein AB6809_34925 [Paraburkholderia sp. RCC_158]|uniref:hypothetical protein n=1 Tax=Paraburkholderia sp. RCC_158 TaxID=3239220 RepID=UPI0035268A3A